MIVNLWFVCSQDILFEKISGIEKKILIINIATPALNPCRKGCKLYLMLREVAQNIKRYSKTHMVILHIMNAFFAVLSL